jgi:hypothetical protein
LNIEIVFDKARLADVKLAPAAASYKIKVVAIATPRVAKAIGAPWLLDRGALVRSGFNLAKTDFVLNSARLKHSLDKTQLEVVSDRVTQFKLFRTGDGKKDAKRLMVCFVAHVVGAPFETLEHWLKVGEGEGTCTLIALQAELDLGGKKDAGRQIPLHAPKAAKKTKGVSTKPPASVDRKASGAREKRKKANGRGMPDAAVTAPLEGTAAGKHAPALKNAEARSGKDASAGAELR